MKFFYKTSKYGMGMIIILALLLQILVPIYENYAIAEGEENTEAEVEVESTIDEKNENIIDENEKTKLKDNELSDETTSKDALLEEESDEIKPKNLGEEKPKEVNKGNGTEFKFITGVKITDEDGNPFKGPIAKDSKIRIQYNYAIEDGFNVDINQKYKLKIPEEIAILNAMEIPLKNSNGDLIATVNIDTNNNVTIQFDENVNTKGMYDRAGYFWVYSEFDTNEVGNRGETDIVFDLGGGSKETVKVIFEKEEEKSNINLCKTGKYDNNKNEITWNIEVKPETTPKGRTISDVIISDLISENQDYNQYYIDGSASIDTNVNGEFNFENNTLSYKFNEPIKDGDIYNITFKTKPDLSAFDSENKKIHFENQAKATFNKDGESISNKASVSTTVNFIQKSGKYNEKTKQIDWTIEINNNNLKIINAKIKDKLPNTKYDYPLKLDTKSIKLNGKEVNISLEGPLTYDGVFLEYSLGDISEKHTLTYSTEVVDPDAYNSNTQKKYKNNAELYGDGAPGNATVGTEVGVPTNVINKSGAGYNPSTQEITWKIVVNNNKTEISDPQVSDNIPVGLEYVPNSFTVDGTQTNDGFNYVKADDSDTEKTGSFIYDFSGKKDIDGKINKTYTITFKTKVLDNNIWANNTSKTFNNTAKLKGSNIPESQSTGSQRVSSQVIEKTGANYNYLTREATWKIVINQNKMPINNAKVTDIMGEYQEFVEGSVKIIGPNKDKAKIDFNKDTNILTVTFSEEIKDEHSIEFKTKVDESIFHTNGNKNLKNTGTLNGDEIPTKGVSSTGTNEIKNTVVGKKGNYKNGNSFIDWEVVINQNQLPISNAILEDTLEEGLELDTASVKLVKLIIDNNGEYKEGEEIKLDASNVKYNPETRKFEFHFSDTINEAHVLKFRTDIADTHKDATFTNTINFNGSSRTVSDTSEEIKVRFQAGGGGIGGSSRGSIKIVKVDEINSSIKLKGAIFELLDSFGNVLKTSEPTGDNGEALFKGLKFDTNYYIREKTSPEGYILSDKLYDFQLKNEDNKKDIQYEFKNIKIKGNIEFNKIDENNKPLAGAEFSIYNKDNDSVSVATAISNDEGKVVFKDVPFGGYIIKETKAPEGYLLSDTILEANITENDATVKANPESISNTKIKGSFELTKIDLSTSKPLANSKIAVYTEDGALVEEKITDKNGIAKFKDLPYGKYYFIEAEAPSGYVKNNEKHPFEIKENGKIVKDTLENEKIKENGPEKPKDPKDQKEPNKPKIPTKPKVEPKKPISNLPKTGENNKLGFYIGGLLLLFLGFALRKRTN